jgi:hypothetical protein
VPNILRKLPARSTTARSLESSRFKSGNKKQAEMKTKALIDLAARRTEAVTYVMARMNRVQNEGALLSNALQKASGEYDMILGSKAKEPILGEIIMTLVFAALPELKVIGRAAKAFTTKRAIDISKVKLGSSIDDNWTLMATELERKTNKVAAQNAKILQFAGSLDNQAKDIIEAIKNPIGASANVDDATQKRLAAFTAKNQLLTELIKSIERRLVQATFLEPILYKFILWYEGEDMLTFLTKLFQLIGFDNDIAYDVKAFDLFSDLILYDMLRTYVKQYFVVDVKSLYDFHFDGTVNTYIPNDNDISGLDSAQRDMVFRKFGKVRWSDKSRPPVSSVKDLVNLWGGSFKVEYLGGGI